MKNTEEPRYHVEMDREGHRTYLQRHYLMDEALANVDSAHKTGLYSEIRMYDRGVLHTSKKNT